MVLLTNSTCRKATRLNSAYAGFWVHNVSGCFHSFDIQNNSEGVYSAGGDGGCNNRFEGKVRIIGRSMYIGGNRLKIIGRPSSNLTLDSVVFEGRKYKTLMKMTVSDYVFLWGKHVVDFYKIRNY